MSTPAPSSLLLCGAAGSGHSYKVRSLLLLTATPHSYQPIALDTPRAERPTDFVAASQFGEVPVLVDGGTAYCQSNAILLHLAQRTRAFCGSASEGSAILEWLFWETNRIGFSVPNLRFALRQEAVGLGASKAKIGPSEDSFCRICSPIAELWGKKTVFSKSGEAKNGPLRSICSRRFPSPTASLAPQPGEVLAYLRERAMADLATLNKTLAGTEFLLPSGPTIADLACSAYLFWLPEAGLTAEDFPCVTRWLNALRALPRWVHPDEALASP